MAPPGSSQTLLSPAELSYIHASLCLDPPVRPDLRSATEFRPLVAETDILPTTNGSARVCFSDGTEAIVGIKAELERSARRLPLGNEEQGGQKPDVAIDDDASEDDKDGDEDTPGRPTGAQAHKLRGGSDNWVEMSIDVPGFREDDALPVFLSSMLSEALLASGELKDRLWINSNWYWKLYIDLLLLSAPLSYPLPLLSLTTHLALLRAALPRRISDPEDDPLFDDDWDAAILLYPRSTEGEYHARPPITLLVMTVGNNVICDPTKDELAVAENVMAFSLVSQQSAASAGPMSMRLVSMRMIDPPSRLTPLGVPDSANPAAFAGSTTDTQGGTHDQEAFKARERGTVWSPPRGGMKRAVLTKIVNLVSEPGGVGEDVLASLAAVDT